MNTTTRKFPRTLREAFPSRESAIGIAGPVIVPTRTFRGSIAERVRKAREWLADQKRKRGEFADVYALYRRAHGPIYSARIAFDCVYRGLPF